jgi:hypothetical protein
LVGRVTGVSGADLPAVREYIVSTITEGARMPTLNQVAEASRQYETALLSKAGAKDIGATVMGSVEVTVNHNTGTVLVTRTTAHVLSKADFLEVRNARY